MKIRRLLFIFMAAVTVLISSCEDKEKTRECREDIYRAYVIYSAVADSLIERTDIKMESLKDSIRMFDAQKRMLDSLSKCGVLTKALDVITKAEITADKDNREIMTLLKIAEDMKEMTSQAYFDHDRLVKDIEILREKERNAAKAYDKAHPASRINEKDTRFFILTEIGLE